MVRSGELRARVAARYRDLGLPSWPDPHAGMTSPREEEYERVTEPGRYGIVHARARVWAECLGEVAGIEVEPLAPAPLDGEGRLGGFDRGVRLISPRPGTLPLLLLERDAPLSGLDASLAVLHISVVRPEIAVAVLPDCGCDACDRGSDDLLQAIDQTVGTVVGGPFVVLRGSGWQALWHPDGGSSDGTGRGPGHDRAMELCRRLAAGEDVRLPGGVEAFVGRPWLVS
ncbi:hypothetical protein Drose_21650 [Dactylosporangium roseum]|uniref:Uncharacterized protein n=1 Tax=Dactylosporangium roseum TaxID=47989 RepID=A0ABY5YVV1_9ACTN|nr:DUF6226 family protein [Dactylosporangium roseum]UWZ33875.1 hypothetical protein Drose_21650 [Dactylosporangium roseum]